MKERCQPQVAFFVGREHKCQMHPSAPLLTFSYFKSPQHLFNLPPAPSTPPPVALLDPPASLHLLRAVPVVILLSETREGRGTHGGTGCSVTMVSLAKRNGAKMRVCVCTHVYRCGRERALSSTSTRPGNGCLAGLPDLSQPPLSQTTRFS